MIKYNPVAILETQQYNIVGERGVKSVPSLNKHSLLIFVLLSAHYIITSLQRLTLREGDRGLISSS